MDASCRPSESPNIQYPVVVHLSYAQAQAVHEALTCVAMDVDWIKAAGSEIYDLAEDAHDAIAYAAAVWQTEHEAAAETRELSHQLRPWWPNRDADTEAEILALSHQLQPWRPDEMTRDFIATPPHGLPFCRTCADWHGVNEAHSLTGGI